MKVTSLVPILVAPLLATLACGARSDLYCAGGVCADLREDSSPDGDGLPPLNAPDLPPRADPLRPLRPGPGQSDPGRNPQRPIPEPTAPDPGKMANFFCPRGEAIGPIGIGSIEDLRRLQGCERIDGDLRISGFPAPDLAPLASLREVTGELLLGTRGSLVGLSALERVGGLTLTEITASSLAPLSRLVAIEGALAVVDSDNLSDLEGLNNARIQQVLEIRGNAGLSSLSGLNVADELSRVAISGNPLLANIDALARVRQVTELHLIGTALGDLSGLGSLVDGGEIVVADSPTLDVSELEDVGEIDLLRLSGLPLANLDGLSRLTRIGILRLNDLPELEHIDALAAVTLSNELSIIGTRVLTRLPSLPAVTSLERLSIEGNSALASGPDLPNVTRIERLNVIGNPQLRDLSGLSTLGQARNIEISDNAELASLDLSSLTSFRSLRVSCNPALPEAALAPLVASEQGVVVTSGNLGSAEPCPR